MTGDGGIDDARHVLDAGEIQRPRNRDGSGGLRQEPPALLRAPANWNPRGLGRGEAHGSGSEGCELGADGGPFEDFERLGLERFG